MGERKYVYLSALDSVRNSPEEIKIALNTLYKELTLTDHTIVLTMQQLTDSKSFISLLSDDIGYKAVENLFESGRLRYSKYRDWTGLIIESPSQYIQQSLEKNIQRYNSTSVKKDSEYIFSGLPVGKDEIALQKAMLSTLEFDSIDYLSEQFDKEKNFCKGEEERKYLENYIALILRLGTIPKSSTPVKEKKRSLKDFFDNIVANGDCGISDVYDNACEILKIISNNREDDNQILSRSWWYGKIKEEAKGKEQKPYRLSQAIIDTLYNMVVEDSISGCNVPEDREGLRKYFIKQLSEYWFAGDSKKAKEGMSQFNLYYSPVHSFLKDADNNIKNVKLNETQKAQWKRLAKLSEDMQKAEKFTDTIGGRLDGETGWKIKLLCLFFYMVVWVAVGMLLYFIIQAISGLNWFGVVSNQWARSLLTIFVIGLITSLISENHVPDILVSSRRLLRGLYYLGIFVKSCFYKD